MDNTDDTLRPDENYECPECGSHVFWLQTSGIPMDYSTPYSRVHEKIMCADCLYWIPLDLVRREQRFGKNGILPPLTYAETQQKWRDVYRTDAKQEEPSDSTKRESQPKVKTSSLLAQSRMR